MSGRLASQATLLRTVSRRPRLADGVALLFQALDAVRSRQILTELDARMLKDIGVSRADAQREAARAPWDLSPKSPTWR